MRYEAIKVEDAQPSSFDRRDGCRWIDLAGATPRDELKRVHAPIANFRLVNVRRWLAQLFRQCALRHAGVISPFPQESAQPSITHCVLRP
jgi:hypothetical protein